MALQLPMPLAWSLYFPIDDYHAQDRRALLIRDLARFFETPAGRPFLSGVRPLPGRAKHALRVDYTDLRDRSKSADLVAALDMQPDEGLACIGAAAYEALFPGDRCAGEPPAGLQVRELTVAVDFPFR